MPEVWADGHSPKAADVAAGGAGCSPLVWADGHSPKAAHVDAGDLDHSPSVSHFWGLLQNSFGTTDVSELFEKHVY